MIKIGGANATVSFAGLVPVGQFQFNVVVPATQAGTLITVQLINHTKEIIENAQDVFAAGLALATVSTGSVVLFEKVPTPIRVRVIRMPVTDRNRRSTQEGQAIPRTPAPLISVTGMKWLLDNTPIEHSAALRRPYADRPDTSG